MHNSLKYLSVDAELLSFDYIPASNSYGTHQLKFQNTGWVDILIVDFKVVGPFTASGTLPSILAPGQIVQLTLSVNSTSSLESKGLVSVEVSGGHIKQVDLSREMDANTFAFNLYRTGLATPTKAALLALVGPFDEAASAAVYADGTTANNGIYGYISNAWVKLADLPDVVAALAALQAQSAADFAAAASRYFTSQALGEAGSSVGELFLYPDGAGGLVFAERTLSGSTIVGEVPTLGPITVAIQAAEAALAAAGTVTGIMAPVSRYAPRAKRWTAPSGMNNPLGIAVDCDGSKFQYTADIHQLNDWAQAASGITNLWWDPIAGNNANTGTSKAQAWQSLDKFVASAPDKSIITLVGLRVGYNANYTGSGDFGSRRIKFITESGQRAIWNSWNENSTVAACAWIADGTSYKSTAAVGFANINTMFDGKYRDQQGLPMPYPFVASLALVKSTPGSWNWDGVTMSVHMIDDRIPDYLTGWIPVCSNSGANFLTDSALTFENMEFAYYSTVGAAGFRARPTTAFVTNTAQLALKNVLSYGSDGNAFEQLDIQRVTMQAVVGGYAGTDILNHSSFMGKPTYPTESQWTTTYEDNCWGRYAGWASGKSAPPASNSNNITTGHRGKHIFRNMTRGDHCPNSWVADVQGCFSMNFGIVPDESTKTGGLFLNNFWNQKLSGEGSAGSFMGLIGCGGQALSAGRVILSSWDDTDTVATLGEIHIADWVGPAAAAYKPGTILKNFDTGATL